MFGKILKDLRLGANESRKELADVIGVSISAISNYENNIRKPDTDIVWTKIAKHYDVTVDYLMGVENSINNNEIKVIAADTISSSPTIIGTTPKIDPLQQKRNKLADRIKNSDYTDAELDKIEQMLDIVVSR